MSKPTDLLLILIYCTSVYGGYIVTAPNRIIPNRNESVCVSLHHLSSNASVNVTITLSSYIPYYRYGPITPGVKNKTIQTVSLTIQPSTNGSKTCVKVIALSTQLKKVDHVVLRVVGMQNNGSYKFNDSRYLSVLLYASDFMTYIQTDKPIYQPGEEAKFRVLSLDSSLRPNLANISRVEIRSPSGTQIRLWVNVATIKGLGEFTLKLSKEPELGNWSIIVVGPSGEAKATFTVNEYVLPKFEVTIHPPASVFTSMSYITVQVCARYTYGEVVKGSTYITTCSLKGWYYDRYMAGSKNKKVQPCDFASAVLSNEDGCAYVNVSAAKLDLGGLHNWRSTRIEYSAYVVEKGTGVQINASSTTSKIKMNDIGIAIEGRGVIKPGIPYYAKLKVAYRDETAVVGKNISISLNSTTHDYTNYYTSDENGEILLNISNGLDDVNIYQLAAAVADESNEIRRPTATEQLSVWHSPQGRYIQFVHQQQELNCDDDVVLRLFYTTNKEEDVALYILVVGNGGIVNSTTQSVTLKADTSVNNTRESVSSWEKAESSRRQWFSSRDSDANGTFTQAPSGIADFYGHVNVTVHITASMYPEASVLVYYITDNGEIISDEVGVKVKPCAANKVSMKFNKVRGKPDEQVTIDFEASPSSLCAYGAVDKSVYLKGGDNLLNRQIFADHLRLYTLSERTGSYLQSQKECAPKNITSKTPKSLTNHNKKRREKRSFVHIPYYSSTLLSSLKAFQSAGVVLMTDLSLNLPACLSERDLFKINRRIAMPSVGSVQMVSRGVALPSLTVRDNFPQTWLWDLVHVDANGEAQVESRLPHTITQWVGNALCLHETDGAGVSETATVTTYQSFFVSASLPYSAIRGETIPISLTVFNYLDVCLPVELRLKSSVDYSVEGTSVVSSCVCSKDSVTQDFLFLPKKVGSINITVTATVIDKGGVCYANMSVDSSLVGVRDAIIRSIIVEPEGAPRQYTVSEFVCMPPKGGNTSKQLELPLPEVDLLVADSIVPTIYVVGDMMGPALANLDDLLQMPYGCGEQNMVGFSPNVFVLQYLQGTNKDTAEIREEAITNMLSGYQREMRYRHSDGSYSAFGPGREDGSIWLTAFVVKCFAQASDYIDVDSGLQKKSIRFFEKNQLANGCFPMVGLVHSKYMAGGVGRRSDGTTALTAYILVSMLEAGVNRSDPVVAKAIDCLSIRPIADNYTLALVTYAFSLYDPTHLLTLELYSELLDASIKDSESTCWKVTTVDNSTEDGTWWYRPKSADVETTSYALLAVLQMSSNQNEKITLGLPIIKWLSQQRNANGGFGSTQDTVIGLQALAGFASLLDFGNLSISTSFHYKNDLSHIATLSVLSSNSLVQQKIEMPKLAPIQVVSNGTGCYLLQVNVRYNVYAEMLKKTAFTISVGDFASDTSNNACKQRKLNICVNYNAVGLSTNMAVVHIRMVSGWAADPCSLKKLVNSFDLSVRRYDIEDNNGVQLYFNQLSRIQLCFNIEIQRVAEVKNTKPAVITVYDYYQKELSSNAKYHIDSCPDTANRDITEGKLPNESCTAEIMSEIISLPMYVKPKKALVMVVDWADRCPVCYNHVETFNVTSGICEYKKAYKTSWRAKENFQLSLTADLRPSKKKKFHKVMINYKLEQGCSCGTFLGAEKRDKLLILGNWTTDVTNGEELLISAGSVVVPIKAGMEKEINRVTKRCRD